MSNGQPDTQSWQPMQLSWLKSTIPFSYWTIAPGAGQAYRHPGSSQCRQASFLISHWTSPPTSISLKRIRSQVSALRSRWLWKLPKFSVGSTPSSFHSLQATSQPLQPMQREMSTSLAYSGPRRIPGAGSGDAEIRLTVRPDIRPSPGSPGRP